MRLPGALIIAGAIAIAVVSLVFNCQAEGQSLTLANGSKVPMKCYWSALAEAAVAVPLLAAGALMWFTKRKESIRGLGIMGAVLGGVSLVIPTVLIGVCANPAHDCNRIMLPTVMLAGTIIVALSVGLLLMNERRREASV